MEPETTEIMEDAFAASIKAMMAGNMFVSLLMAGALQYLFGMINSIQLMMLGLFFSLLQPPNAKIIQIELYKAVAFDFFQTETIYVEVFGFKDSESFNDAFDEAGVQGSTFIIGIGPIFFFIIIFPVFIFFHQFVSWLFKGEQKIKCIKNYIKPKNYLVIAVVFIIESSLELLMTSCICILMMREERVSTAAEVFSTILTILILVALAITPIYLFVGGIRLYKARLRHDRATVKKLKPIFEG